MRSNWYVTTKVGGHGSAIKATRAAKGCELRYYAADDESRGIDRESPEQRTMAATQQNVKRLRQDAASFMRRAKRGRVEIHLECNGRTTHLTTCDFTNKKQVCTNHLKVLPTPLKGLGRHARKRARR